MPSAYKKTAIGIVLVILLVGIVPTARAAFSPFSPTVTRNTEIDSPKYESGNIVSLRDGKYVLSEGEYDQRIVGVVDQKAAIVFETYTDTANAIPVVFLGEAFVLVNTSGGPIKIGDALTSSSTSGVGMKAVKSSIVLGQALESYSETNPQTAGAILVAVNPHFFSGSSFFANLESSMLSLVKGGTMAATDAPSKFLRYFFATVIAVISVVLALLNFGKAARSGVEAIGRNPLARQAITLGIMVNVGLTVVVLGVGIFLSYLILSL